MGRSPSTWTPFRCCVGWPPACPRRDSTRSTTRGSPKGRLRAARRGKPMALARHPAFAPYRGGCARSLPLGHEPEKRVRKSGYRPWAELLQRTFSVDVAQGLPATSQEDFEASQTGLAPR
jgi:hypothetical protein